MNQRRGKQRLLLMSILLIAGVIAFVGYLVFAKISEGSRQVGRDLSHTIDTKWPEGSSPSPVLRDKLQTLGLRLQEGRTTEAVETLSPVRPPTEQERLAAQKFFNQSPELRTRFLATSSAAQNESERGTDVQAIRDSLARSLRAAVNHDRAYTLEHLDLADRILEDAALGDTGDSLASDADAVASLVESLSSAYRLNRDLLTEGHASAEKLLVRAKGHLEANAFRQAASKVRLAARLLGIDPVASSDAKMPDWFDRLEVSSLEVATSPQVAAALDLCRAMAAAETPGEPIETLIAHAERCQQSGQHDEAFWWASVALSAMGMTDQAIASAMEMEPVE